MASASDPHFSGRGEPTAHDTAFSANQLMAIVAITVRQPIAIHCRCCRVCPRTRQHLLHAVKLTERTPSGSALDVMLKSAVRALDHGRICASKRKILARYNDMGSSVEVREKILEPFFTTKPSGQGTGLSLSLSYDIVVKQRGQAPDRVQCRSMCSPYSRLPCPEGWRRLTDEPPIAARTGCTLRHTSRSDAVPRRSHHFPKCPRLNKCFSSSSSSPLSWA
jgi:hypothetical protein